MDDELELLIDDMDVTNPTSKPSINEVGEELVGCSDKRLDESGGKCLVDEILDAEFVERMRAKVQARKKARIVQELEGLHASNSKSCLEENAAMVSARIVQELEGLHASNSKSCLEENAAMVSAMLKSKDSGIGADVETAMMKILVDVHDLLAMGAKLVGQIEVEREKFAAEEKSKLEYQNDIEKIKAEIEQVRKEKEKEVVENAAAKLRAIMYMGWWIGVKEELSKAKEELASRRAIEANDSVSLVGVGQVNEGNRMKLDFDLNVIPEDCVEDQEELEEGEIRQCV